MSVRSNVNFISVSFYREHNSLVIRPLAHNKYYELEFNNFNEEFFRNSIVNIGS